MSIVVDGMISKLQSAVDFEDWAANLVEAAGDYDSGTISAYLLRLVARDKCEAALEELREQHENLFKIIDVLSGKHDLDLFEQIQSHDEFDDYLEDVHGDLPRTDHSVSDFYLVRLLASDEKIQEIRQSFDDLEEGEKHLKASCLRMLDGTETESDIEAVIANEHPEDVADAEAAQAANTALEYDELSALRDLQSKLSSQGRRSSSQETLLAAVGKVLKSANG